MNNSTVENVMDSVHNWFSRSTLYGCFTVRDGALEVPSLAEGQYYRIVGSTFNDGLHKEGDTDLTDEEFNGKVYLLAVPSTFLDLCEEIEKWVELNSKTILGPFKYESFGGYTYTIAEDKDGNPITWQSVFRMRLKRWRKIA